MREPDQSLDRLAHDVIGAAIEVHRSLGSGFLEATYAKALAIELRLRGIPHLRESPVQLEYKGESLGEGRLDLLVDDRLVVELKAVDSLAPIHEAQVISYLKATGLELGLLINYNTAVLRDGIKRIILT
ncbi:MAG: GxxExxY protein [Phycisphaerales bacterium JB063]